MYLPYMKRCFFKKNDLCLGFGCDSRLAVSLPFRIIGRTCDCNPTILCIRFQAFPCTISVVEAFTQPHFGNLAAVFPNGSVVRTLLATFG